MNHNWLMPSFLKSLLTQLLVELEILYLLENYPILIIVGTTGCGKSTQIPQYLVENGWASGEQQICCTQPRRIAALNLATRVAEEMNSKVGDQVGYCIRFENVTSGSNRTKIKYVTDGVLIREIMHDPLLSSYSVIILDEAHERSLNTDILLGLLKKLQSRRMDLRLIISSATVDALEFQSFFNTKTPSSTINQIFSSNKNDIDSNTPIVLNKNWINTELHGCASILSIDQPSYPVNIFYTSSPLSDYHRVCISTIFQIHRFEPLEHYKRANNDILVFLTGQEEVEQMARTIKEEILLQEQESSNQHHHHKDLIRSLSSIKVLFMYACLDKDQQWKVFQPTEYGTRKVILSTNLCETSVTIDGIGYVIDCGFMKVRKYNASTDQETLAVAPISQSAAKQRAGRAGRTGPGKCFRLYPESVFDQLEPKSVPEIVQSQLTSTVLQLKGLGIDNLSHFPFITHPPSSNMIRAFEKLYALDAIDDKCKLTSLGLSISEFPLDPRHSVILMKSTSYHCSETILSILSMLSVPEVFLSPKGMAKKVETQRRKFAVYEGDHLTLLNIYNNYIQNNRNSQWLHAQFLNQKVLLKAFDLRKALKSLLHRMNPNYKKPKRCTNEELERNLNVESIQKCLLSGYFMNAARLQPDGSYKTIQGYGNMYIHPRCILNRYPPEWIIFDQVVQTTRLYLTGVTKINPIWLAEVAPHYYQNKGISAM